MSEFTGGNVSYNPGELSGNMHLSEAEIHLAIQMYNEICRFDTEYDSIANGSALELHSLSDGDPLKREKDKPFHCKVRLFNVERGLTYIDGENMLVGTVELDFSENPPCKMFEAVLLECDGLDRAPGEEVFGLLFRDGFALLVDSGPEDDLTDRRIRAMIALKGGS